MNALPDLQAAAHATATEKGFWDDAPWEDRAAFNTYIGNKLMLIVGEVAEAHECLRKGEWETYLDARGKPEGLPVELADIALRLLDLCGALGINLQDEIDRKAEYNRSRERLHGKAF